MSWLKPTFTKGLAGRFHILVLEVARCFSFFLYEATNRLKHAHRVTRLIFSFRYHPARIVRSETSKSSNGQSDEV